MVHPEYVGLSLNERVYGQKNFLRAELELLSLLKGFKSYKKLRREELVLKVTLRSKIAEVFGMLDKFERKLPKATYGKVKVERVERKKRVKPGSLQEEMQEIRERLARLGGDF